MTNKQLYHLTTACVYEKRMFNTQWLHMLKVMATLSTPLTILQQGHQEMAPVSRRKSWLCPSKSYCNFWHFLSIWFTAWKKKEEEVREWAHFITSGKRWLLTRQKRIVSFCYLFAANRMFTSSKVKYVSRTTQVITHTHTHLFSYLNFLTPCSKTYHEECSLRAGSWGFAVLPAQGEGDKVTSNIPPFSQAHLSLSSSSMTPRDTPGITTTPPPHSQSQPTEVN